MRTYSRIGWLPISLLALVIGLLATFGSTGTASASPGITTQDLTTGLTATDIANSLVGGGISISNVTYTGANDAAGTFAGGTGIIGFESGVILSTGSIANVIGPNLQNDITTINDTPGDTDLNALASFPTYDAAVLEFDFVPQASSVAFQYVFASDEYNEYVNTEFNDVFAFYVNGTNCATVPGPNGPQPVSINTVNNGNPFGTTPNSNPNLFINNAIPNNTLDTEMDGLTVVLTCLASVNAGVSNHMKLAIADASDATVDSNVFLKAGSFAVATPTATAVTPGATTTAVHPLTATPTMSATAPATATAEATATPLPPTATAVPPTNTPTGGEGGVGIRPPSTGSGGAGDGTPMLPYAGAAAAAGLALLAGAALRLRRR